MDTNFIAGFNISVEKERNELREYIKELERHKKVSDKLANDEKDTLHQYRKRASFKDRR